ncbi:hypothetical protein EX30DRAFT_256309 [Ascodesmis nigricans]|uniref:Uncharacterized protein n=1 Tax=Ascodesmis nigricans TaxID=341454 RepID=A0A4S2MMG1_9PEZI|nr:hypothetical protein EX30DRAFT_256309 [Ascodesmis nigricans]
MLYSFSSSSSSSSFFSFLLRHFSLAVDFFFHTISGKVFFFYLLPFCVLACIALWIGVSAAVLTFCCLLLFVATSLACVCFTVGLQYPPAQCLHYYYS